MDNKFYQKCLSWSRVYAEGEYATASTQKIAAFANSVAYLMTGASGGYGGPSMREHAVSWASAGSGAEFGTAETDLGPLTVVQPDGSLPSPGQWTFEQASAFAAPIVFGPLTDLHRGVFEAEYCFDDDPDDLKDLEE